jgi:hypothetical protein
MPVLLCAFTLAKATQNSNTNFQMPFIIAVANILAPAVAVALVLALVLGAG